MRTRKNILVKDFLLKGVLELGYGSGRNSIYMAKQGCSVSALDISEKAIIWAKEREKN
ncbi:class I SAM-dependent methyltransferase [Lysinibacillus sphaericus]|uniref:class I SAM-dependent methyltransferase n=1 Tax=Lysinibacillus sphaericus TaxID=1421 RepID=UPI00382DA07A